MQVALGIPVNEELKAGLHMRDFFPLEVCFRLPGISLKYNRTGRRESNQVCGQSAGASDIDRRLQQPTCQIDRIAGITAIEFGIGESCRLLRVHWS